MQIEELEEALFFLPETAISIFHLHLFVLKKTSWLSVDSFYAWGDRGSFHISVYYSESVHCKNTRIVLNQLGYHSCNFNGEKQHLCAHNLSFLMFCSACTKT